MLETFLTHVPLSFFAFTLCAAVTVGGAAGVAFSGNIVYAAFSLLFAFAGVAGLFAFMSADFLAIVQLMVYVGGILVLILFAVMLTNRITDVKRSNPSSNVALGLAVTAIVLAVLLKAILAYDWPTRPAGPYEPTASSIGEALLGPYLLPFEVAGLLLLAALLAAVVVARKEVKDVEEGAAEPEGGAR